MSPFDPGPEDPSGLKTLENFGRARRFNYWLFKSFSSYCSGNVLETGSGTGNISKWLLQEGNPVTLSDLRMEYCRKLLSKFEHVATFQGVYPLDLSDPDFEKNNPQLLRQFDTVVALNVIEHIGDDRLALRNCKKLLTHKGRLIILVPAYQALHNSFDENLGHHRRYSRRGLVGLLESEGYELVRSKYFNAAGLAGWWLLGSVLRAQVIPAFSLRLFDFFVPLWKLLDLLLFRRMGLSVIAVAEISRDAG